METKIILETTTWHRDSHGLFDYESKSISKRVFENPNNLKIIRAGTDTITDNE